MTNEQPKTTIETLPLGRTVLCKHAKTEWSEIVLITKLALAKHGNAVLVRRETNYVGGNQPGLSSHTSIGWCDLKDLSKKYEVFDEFQ